MIKLLKKMGKPIDIIICICVMSFVVLVIRLGMEKSCISSLPISITWLKSFSLTV